MSIDALVAGVELAPNEPSGIRRLPVEDSFPGLIPIELAGLLHPEPLGGFQGATIHLSIPLERPYPPISR
jgi:hypothetical protein